MAVPGIKAVIFDCFGVLYVDSKVSLLDIVPTEKRQELHDLFVSNNYGYFGRKEYLAQVASIVGLSEAEVARYIAHEHRLNEPLISLIRDQLKDRYRIGLLSNIGREWIHDFFSRHQLHELFDDVVLSGEEGISKPNPAIYELAASRLGISPGDCVMIDDIADNCEGAEIAGMMSIRYQSNDQLLETLYERGIL